MEKIKVFVAHVKKGYEQRAAHMEKMLGEMGIEFTYMLDGDIPDLTQDTLDKYFIGDMNRFSPAASCATKHLLIMEKMVAQGIREALILEDDMFLTKDFNKVLAKSREEVAKMNAEGKPVWVGFEATCLKITPRSIRRKGQVVYPSSLVQCMGAYYLNLPMAKYIIDKITEEKTSLPTDGYVEVLRWRDLPDSFFWSYPVVAEQGSHNGRMASIIDPHKQPQRARLFKRKITMAYKRIVAFFR